MLVALGWREHPRFDLAYVDLAGLAAFNGNLPLREGVRSMTLAGSDPGLTQEHGSRSAIVVS